MNRVRSSQVGLRFTFCTGAINHLEGSHIKPRFPRVFDHLIMSPLTAIFCPLSDYRDKLYAESCQFFRLFAADDLGTSARRPNELTTTAGS